MTAPPARDYIAELRELAARGWECPGCLPRPTPPATPVRPAGPPKGEAP